MPVEDRTCCGRLSQKWIFTVAAFFAVACMMAMRMTLPLTIPKMVPRHVHAVEFEDDVCPTPERVKPITVNNYTTTNVKLVEVADETYDWDELTQGVILGSFYWGYVLSHVPGGVLAERFGGKYVLGLGMLGAGVCTVATPWTIDWGGARALIVLRILMGLFEGLTQPALSVMMSQWVPREERSRITGLIFVGGTFGVGLICLGLGPIVASDWGWRGVYYIFGGASCLWFGLFAALCYNSPREHPFIGREEQSRLGAQLAECTHRDAPPVPWRHLLTSAPFWALVAVTCGKDWGAYTILSDLPKYTMNVLKMTDEENAWLFIGANVCMTTSALLFSWLSDQLIVHNWMSVTNVRKLMTSIALTVHGFLSVWSAYVACDKLQYFVLSFVGTFTVGASFPGIRANTLDLSPNYAGTVTAISHGLAGLCGIGGPYLVGLVAVNQTLSEWQLVFWIICAVGVATNLVYLLLGSGELQPWNSPDFQRKRSKRYLVVPQSLEKIITIKKNNQTIPKKSRFIYLEFICVRMSDIFSLVGTRVERKRPSSAIGSKNRGCRLYGTL
ncbi:sialin-like [Trichogramma pretiosum]|uniref:sialin-like n=1 Tax=Trichogramma pretiosum TaxID=7493 RepID=UPI0006C9A1BD|nr:sialin-like [Trichogramma pretiosum]